MKRLKFYSNGRLASVDDATLDSFSDYESKSEPRYEERSERVKKLVWDDESFDKVVEQIRDDSYWNLNQDGKRLEPLKFSNGKTQEDVVKEVVGLIKGGKKIVFIHGACGTGKSAIALNIARKLGRASIVVPVKGLQKQYEEDYTSKKYVLKSSGKKMKIAMITGRDNHDSLIKPGASCADSTLPDTVQFSERNLELIKEYYEQNPIIKNKEDIDIKKLKRIAIAPANPYWSPIAPADYELPLRDAKKRKYMGLNDKEFIFYHRKEGCTYYDQYKAYLDADVIIFNSAKYKIEVALDRKPATDVEIIDEADEFLDNFSTQIDLNLTRLYTALNQVSVSSPDAKIIIDDIQELIRLEEKNKQATGVDENAIFAIKDTKLEKMIKLLIKNKEVNAEIMADELNYGNKALEAAENFIMFLEDTFLTYRKDKEKGDLYVNLVTTNLSSKFREIVDKNKSLVLMSGTLHSPEVLRDIFGIEDFSIVDAETLTQGTIEIVRTGKEFDCRYSTFQSGKKTRKDYLEALSACMSRAKKPTLVHVNAFEDLPSEVEVSQMELFSLMAKEKLKELQYEDKTGKMISQFKQKKMDSLFTTKCSRGVDFPGDICNSMIFTKYPNPNVNDTFWKILQKTHADYYWEFYRDKARREFLQRLYRAIRSKDDHVYVLSPDMRILDAVRDLQLANDGNGNGKK